MRRDPSREPGRKDSKGNSMTTIERMALAMWRADALRELGPPVYDDIPDNLRETYLGYAKSALAALLPLDEEGVEATSAVLAAIVARDAPQQTNGEVARAAITAYLEHIGGETQTYSPAPNIKASTALA